MVSVCLRQNFLWKAEAKIVQSFQSEGGKNSSFADIYRAVSMRNSSASTLRRSGLTFGREVALMEKRLFCHSKNPHKSD